jgi:hypothetical protein
MEKDFGETQGRNLLNPRSPQLKKECLLSASKHLILRSQDKRKLTSPAATVMMCGVKPWPAEPASTTPGCTNQEAACGQH